MEHSSLLCTTNLNIWYENINAFQHSGPQIRNPQAAEFQIFEPYPMGPWEPW